MPLLEQQLGPGVAEALARTAEQLKQDSAVLDALTADMMPTVFTPLLGEGSGPTRATLEVAELERVPQAILGRVIRKAALEVFGSSLSAVHTNSIARLITDWHGQGEVHVPGIRVERQGAQLVLTTSKSTPTEA
jgi:tRNA(Ile)-lysidine synthase